MDIEKEIDHRIELMGIRLGPDQDNLRNRIRRDIEIEEAKRTYKENNQPALPTFKLRL